MTVGLFCERIIIITLLLLLLIILFDSVFNRLFVIYPITSLNPGRNFHGGGPYKIPTYTC